MNKTETETGRILKTLVRELSRKESGKYDPKSSYNSSKWTGNKILKFLTGSKKKYFQEKDRDLTPSVSLDLNRRHQLRKDQMFS